MSLVPTFMCAISQDRDEIRPASRAAAILGAPERGRRQTERYAAQLLASDAPAFSVGGPRLSLDVFGNFHCGDVPALEAAIRDANSPVEVAGLLIDRSWGAYVAFIMDEQSVFAFRDPSGAIPLYITRAGKTQIASTHLTPSALKAAEHEVRINHRAVGKLLGSPPAPAFLSGLFDIEIVTPGELVALDAAGDPQRIWQPNSIASRGFALAPEQLVSTLDGVLGRLADGRRIGVELSGGVDSSIVCASLAQLGIDPRPFNFATRGKGGDETRFAADVADRWKLALHRFSGGDVYPDYSAFEGLEHGVQPALHGLDSVFAAARQELVDREDIDLVMTGQGGDSLFFNIPTRLVTADRRQRLGVGSILSRHIIDDAKRVRGSVWSAAAAAFGRRTPQDRGDREWLTPRFLGDEARLVLNDPLPEHPWLAGCDELPPAKRMHLNVLAHCQIYYGGRLHGCSVPVIHPLLTQPMIELALACPTYELQFGSRDRGLARRAFQDRLPQSVLQRRNKGEASDHYARAILKNRDWLRSFLLEGRLVEAGLLNGPALGQAMSIGAIHLGTDYRAFVQYASIESWMRYWS